MFSYGIIAENFEVLRMTFLIERFCGWYVSVNGILSVSSFCEVCSAVSRSISWARCLPGKTQAKQGGDWRTASANTYETQNKTTQMRPNQSSKPQQPTIPLFALTKG